MDILIGLIQKGDTCEKNPEQVNRKISYTDSMLMAEVKSQRIITPIDISRCTKNSEKTRIDSAIWDTGATISCISEKLAREMELLPVDTGIGITPSGAVRIVYYLLDVYVSPTIMIKNVKVAGFPLEQRDCEFVIGMDIISKGSFSLTSSHERMQMNFKM